MAREHSIQRYRYCYTQLLRLYPKPFHERYGESMEQTFNDLLRERAKAQKGLFSCVLWMFVETFAGAMRENTMQNKHVVRPALVTALVLVVPLVAMQFSNEVNWGPLDFIVMAALLFGTGLTYELIASRAGATLYRVALGVALLAALILVWVNLAVGLVEYEFPNLIYAAVLAVGIIGAVVARLQPQGMSRALFAMALAHSLVAVLAVLADIHKNTASRFLIGNGFFVALWILSASLFRSSTRQGQKSV